ncbi:hypothetical protein HAX54_027647, partial [Datura stramonium]|nr:hypothetical protein [Datura stramonium]
PCLGCDVFALCGGTPMLNSPGQSIPSGGTLTPYTWHTISFLHRPPSGYQITFSAPLETNGAVGIVAPDLILFQPPPKDEAPFPLSYLEDIVPVQPKQIDQISRHLTWLANTESELW